MYETNSLVVLGNGFDLNIGLKSGYKDFFKSIGICEGKCEDQSFNNDIKNIKNNLSNLKDIKSKTQYSFLNSMEVAALDSYRNNLKNKVEEHIFEFNNFWINYFSYMSEMNMNYWNKIKNWSDIENRINEVVTHKKSMDLIYTLSNGNIDSYIDKLPYSSIEEDCESLVFLKLLNSITSETISRNKIYEILLDDLKIFENKFKSYLQNILKNDIGLEEYNAKANDLMVDLINFDGVKDINDLKYSLINFNYTSFYNIDDKIKINVHSDINNGHPIFGIDSKVLNKIKGENNDIIAPYFKFTKTFRIMDLASRNTMKKVLRTNIDKIIFYGHSLSDADYSYFLSIFDYYNLYDSDLILVFKYNAHNKNLDEKSENQDASEEKEKTKVNVFKMVNKYGSEIEHGDNLLHKLLLENRLIFERTINYNSKFN